MSRRNILFVCTGNICRSPVAASMLRGTVQESQYSDAIRVDSCGTTDSCIGQTAALEAIEWAGARGYDLSGHRARLFRASDVHEFDLILGMARSHVDWLQRLRPNGVIVDRFLDYATGGRKRRDVPDPYGGDAAAYKESFRQIEEAMPSLLEAVRRSLDETATR